MPKVHNKNQSERCAIVPHFMLKGIVDNDHFSFLPSSVEEENETLSMGKTQQ